MKNTTVHFRLVERNTVNFRLVVTVIYCELSGVNAKPLQIELLRFKSAQLQVSGPRAIFLSCMPPDTHQSLPHIMKRKTIPPLAYSTGYMVQI